MKKQHLLVVLLLSLLLTGLVVSCGGDSKDAARSSASATLTAIATTQAHAALTYQSEHSDPGCPPNCSASDAAATEASKNQTAAVNAAATLTAAAKLR